MSFESLLRNAQSTISAWLGGSVDWGIYVLLLAAIFFPVFYVLRRIAYSSKPREFDGSLTGLASHSWWILKGVCYLFTAALLGTGLYCFRIATPNNGLLMIAIVLTALGLIVWLKVQEIGKLVRPQFPDLIVTRVVTGDRSDEPVLNAGAVQEAKALLEMGQDIESVCRDVNPAYPTFSPAEKEAFRSAIHSLGNAKASGSAS